jgi:hypothetical protein
MTTTTMPTTKATREKRKGQEVAVVVTVTLAHFQGSMSVGTPPTPVMELLLLMLLLLLYFHCDLSHHRHHHHHHHRRHQS